MLILSPMEDTIRIVTPVDGIVAGTQIPEYTNTWEMTAVQPDGTIVDRGVWHDTMSSSTINGRDVLKRVQLIHYRGQKTTIQEDEFYRDNLQHIHLRIHNDKEEPHTEIMYTEKRIFGKKIFRVDGLAEMDQLPLAFSFELIKPVFDWHLWGILVSGFPLQSGYQARFLAHESYSYYPGDFRWFTLRVTGQETIDGGKWGMIDCYTVDVQAEVIWKLWIAVDKKIAPVQQIRIDDKDGVQLWWKPKKDCK